MILRICLLRNNNNYGRRNQVEDKRSDKIVYFLVPKVKKKLKFKNR